MPGDNHLITRRSRFRIDIPAAIPLFRLSGAEFKYLLGYRWQHEAVIALARPTPEQIFELSAAEAEEWYRGYLFRRWPGQRDHRFMLPAIAFGKGLCQFQANS
jgi:hypothetical protein